MILVQAAEVVPYLYHETIARSPNNLTESEGQESSYTPTYPVQEPLLEPL